MVCDNITSSNNRNEERKYRTQTSSSDDIVCLFEIESPIHQPNT
jgi:hypothetical protein